MNDSIKLMFTGDISLNGNYAKLAKNKIDPFKEIAPYMKESDLCIGNLEAVCAHIKGKHIKKQTRLSIDHIVLPFLKSLNLGLITLANNHVFDNLEGGLDITLKFLEKNQINYTGASLSSNNHEPYIFEKNGEKIAFLNYVHPYTHPGVNQTHSIKLNFYDKNKIISSIKSYKKTCHYVFLILHWGQDNSHYPAPWQRKDARNFVKAGCDLLIGHHSHVLQGMEKIKNSLVFYGLGNFAFAPLNKQDKLDQSRQIDTVLVSLLVGDKNLEYTVQPIRLFDLIPKPIGISKFNKLSRNIPFVSNYLIWPFYLFYVNILYKIFFFFWGNDRKPLEQIRKINKVRLKRFFRIMTSFRK